MPRVQILTAVLLVTTTAPFARAQENISVLAGPVIAWTFGANRDGSGRLTFGWEGGPGLATLRLNFGQQFRPGGAFSYMVFEPWVWVGLSAGVGIDRDGGVPVLGAWEGVAIPSEFSSCDVYENGEFRDFVPTVTIALGYRWARFHELYLTPKVGAVQPGCLP